MWFSPQGFPKNSFLEHKYHHFVPVDMHVFSEVDHRKMLGLSNVARKDLQYIDQKILNRQNISKSTNKIITHIYLELLSLKASRSSI
jgi:hypothetical protein